MKTIIRLITFILLATASIGLLRAETSTLTLHKRAGCKCCDAHARLLEEQGFEVDVVSHNDLGLLKDRYNVPRRFRGCHTITADNYLVEGHVPGDVIKQLFETRPEIRGISLPGMPVGSPGMPGPRDELLDVLVIDSKKHIVFDQF